MKDNIEKEKQLNPNINKNQESLKKNLVNSPKKPEKKDTNNFISSPEDKSMNQKYFPSKENYFGVKVSPEKKNLHSYSPPTNSPILNYFSGLSGQDEKVYSPPKNYLENNNYHRKFSPNFEANHTVFFEKILSDKNIGNINKEESISLQERIVPFVMGGDSNKYIAQNKYPRYNSNSMNDEEEEEDNDEENNEEAFTLTINNINDINSLESNKEIQNYTNNNINKEKHNDKDIKENLNSEESDFNKKSDKKLYSISSSNDNQVKNMNMINKREFLPYIPDKFKDIPYIVNYPQEHFENNNFYNQNIDYINNSNNFNQINYYYYNNNIDFSNMNEDQENKSQIFFYKGDNYQINDVKENQKEDYKKTGSFQSITQEDFVTTITSNNKVIKRINPNVYLNESLEFLAFNILPLSQDQAGCRFLQEKIDNDPKNSVQLFFTNLLPNILLVMKDPFGNYLVQKLYHYLNPENIKLILEIISNNIYELGSNNHGARCIENIIDHLSNPDLVKLFLTIIKPHIISLLKEMHGVHIINKFIFLHPECSYDIHKIIVENCSLLATHKHGCFFLQNILEGPDKSLKSELIKNLIDNCFVLIIDQFGNYIIQSILHLNNNKYSSDIALIISDNVQYYSKHRYSCNVIEKCFDFCGKKERNILIDKLCTPEIISELILDEHGNYVIQKVLFYAEKDKKELIFKVIKSMIPKIRNTSFGNKLLNRLFHMYPQMNVINNNEKNINIMYQNNWNRKNYGYKNRTNKGFQRRNNNYMNKFNNQEKGNYTFNNKYDLINNEVIFNNQDMKMEKPNSSINKIYNINNNTINININSNIENKEDNKKSSNKNENDVQKSYKKIDNINLLPEQKKKKKKKKGKKQKKSSDDLNRNDLENNKDELK